VYAPTNSPYDVRDGFTKGFGRDLVWWLTLSFVLVLLAMFELGYKVVKRNLIVMGVWKYRWRWLSWKIWGRFSKRRGAGIFTYECDEMDNEEWDLELWQEMEQDAGVKERLRLMYQGGSCGVVEEGDSADCRREDA